MKKTLRLLTAGVFAMLCGSVYAGTETYTFSDDYSTTTRLSNADVECEHFTMSFAKGTGTSYPTYYYSDVSARVYAGNTLTFTGNDTTITAITFEFVNSDYSITEDKGSFDVGSYDYDTYTWTGDADTVVLTNNGSGQIRIVSVTVTYPEEEETDEGEVWSLCGDVTGDNWSTFLDFEYQGSGVYTLELETMSGGFKINKDHAWDVQYGSNGSTVDVGTTYTLKSNGDNLSFTNSATLTNATLTLTVTDDAVTLLAEAESYTEITENEYYLIGDFDSWSFTDKFESTDTEGVYTIDVDAISGTFKIALNGAWVSSYGSNGSKMTINEDYELSYGSSPGNITLDDSYENVTFTLTIGDDDEGTLLMQYQETEEEPAGTKHTFNIDNADNIYLLLNGSDTLDIVSGKNVFYVDYDSLGASSVYYRIQSKDDCFVTSVSYASDDDESISGTGYVSSYKRCYLYLYSTYGDVTVDVTTANVDDRTNTLIVNVDSADIVSFKLYATSTQIELENGENTVKFADFENRMYVAHISPYSYSLYKVELNGVEQEISGYYYYIDVEDGDTLDITAIIPDMDVKFTITLPDGIDDFIESFEVNYEEIEPEVYLADDYTIKAGSYVYLYGNTTDYQVDSLLVNGTKKSFYSSYSATIMEDTELEFFLTKYGVDTVYITIDNPDAVTIYAGNYLELEEGRNLVEVSQNVSYISYYANDGYYVDSVVVDGVTQTRSYFYPENGMEIEFYTGIINRDQTYALYIDDATNVSYVYVGSTEYYDAGYYTCAFYDGDLPIYAYSSSYNVEPYVYLNDELQTGDVDNWGSIYAYYYFYTLVDGDVIKYYFAGEPSTYTATFTTVGDASAVTVTKDIIVAVSDWADGISALQGTQVNIAGDGILSVTVDEEALEATDGEYIFTIDADKAVVITMSETTEDGDDDEDGETDGITAISASSLGTSGDVYNAAGVLLIKDATTEQIASLARGLYIINGTKVVK